MVQSSIILRPSHLPPLGLKPPPPPAPSVVRTFAPSRSLDYPGNRSRVCVSSSTRAPHGRMIWNPMV
eukprot:4481504-Pyramimonas_sp.AAC.2